MEPVMSPGMLDNEPRKRGTYAARDYGGSTGIASR
jgi:hypothetical protein